MILLLAPEKLISSSTFEEWKVSLPNNVVLFTAYGSAEYRNLLADWGSRLFHHVELFSDYANNDLMELRAIELHQKTPFTTIIPMAEADVLRAARLRERLNIPGQSFNNALLFRDKVRMKMRAQECGIALPRFRVIKDTLDLLDFIEEVNYPVVVKPIMGRGSLNTFLIKDKAELEEKLNSGFISNTSRYTDLLVEEYIDGEVYHVDGLQIDHIPRVLSVSKYVNNCLSFVNGSYLGSYTLENKNPLHSKILIFTEHLIKNVFTLPKNALMHIEVFVDQNEKLWLCEIACRIGGNGINDEVKLRYGIDIKLDYVRAECGLPYDVKEIKSAETLAARLLIPPQEGKLITIPNNCSDPKVLRYQNRGIIGKIYQKMQMSNDEIANFLFIGDNEQQIQEKLSELAAWFYERIQWETT